MTRAEWLACTEPERMLAFLRGKASDRKLRLFACACCRRIWHLLPDEPTRAVVEAVERYADNQTIGDDELMAFAPALPTACWVLLWPASLATASTIKGA